MDLLVTERTQTGFACDNLPIEAPDEPGRAMPGINETMASFPDPLDPDDLSDDVVVTTRRAIARVALVATETASRFQRESIPQDAMTWMFAPRRIFDGSAAIDACLDREACMRGILVHGLGLGLDPERSVIDALLADDDDELEEHEFRYLRAQQSGSAGREFGKRAKRTAKLRLYTATIVSTRDHRMLQAFHASVARSSDEVRARLAGRFGPEVAEAADIRLGLRPASPVVVALVPSAVAALIIRMAQDCASPAARNFAVDIQQCIQG